MLHDYQKARVETFLDPESDALGKGWNITQAKIAIGSGGVGGKGFTQGTQSRLNFLPEKQTDFIWTSFCEEFGFVGALALLILFAVVIFYGVQTAMSARSQFARLLAMGVQEDSFNYNCRLAKDGLPWVLECAFGWLGDDAPDERRIYAGANWSASARSSKRA